MASDALNTASRDENVLDLNDLKHALRGTAVSEESVSDEEIVALHHGELSEQRAKEVREFVMADPEWVRTLEEADDLEALEAEAATAAPDVDAAWAAFQSRLGEPGTEDDELENAPVSAAVVPFAPRDREADPAVAAVIPSRPGVSPWWQIAAILILGIGLGGFGVYFLSQAANPVSADSAIRLVELEPLRPEAGPLMGGESNEPVSAPEHEVLLLKLWPLPALERDGDPPPSGTFRLLLDGAVAYQGLAEWQDDAYVASVPIRLLETADYQIELSVEPEPGQPTTLTYRLPWQADSH